VLIEPWAVYVKEGEFFEEQGGLTKPWGKNWITVQANSIEHARKQGLELREMKI
jgi:hypothetical protein